MLINFKLHYFFIFLLSIPSLLFAEIQCNFNYLENEYPKLYKNIVVKTNTIPKIFTFCHENKHYLFNASMFQQLNDGKGINRALEKDLLSFYLKKYDANSFSRTSLRAGNQKIELITTIINRKPLKAIELVEEIFIDETSNPRVKYGKMFRTIKLKHDYFNYFELIDHSDEELEILKKFEPFIGMQELKRKVIDK